MKCDDAGEAFNLVLHVVSTYRWLGEGGGVYGISSGLSHSRGPLLFSPSSRNRTGRFISSVQLNLKGRRGGGSFRKLVHINQPNTVLSPYHVQDTALGTARAKRCTESCLCPEKYSEPG